MATTVHHQVKSPVKENPELFRTHDRALVVVSHEQASRICKRTGPPAHATDQRNQQLKEHIPNYFRMLEAMHQLRREVETQAALPIPTNPGELEAELRYWVTIASGMPEQIRKVVEICLRAERGLTRALRSRKRELLELLNTEAGR